jgi:uncharacterized protein (TIGR02677 family)
MADAERLRLYGYITSPEADDYLAVMSAFTQALLVEWSAQDVADHGVDLPVEVIAARCRYLADHGNLLLSPREVRVSSIAEYQSQPARYTVSALGARLHREVEAFLSVTGGAREVPKELLALIAHGLRSLDPHGEPAELAGAVSTVFGQFREFASSVTDFYTYIGSVLNRSDLDGDEWSGFKALLIDYLESIVESVRLHTPAIAAALERLHPHVDSILERIGDAGFAALEAAGPGGETAERAQGRRRTDWDDLEQWFSGPGSRQLRDAAHRAVGSLLNSLKRINSASTKEASLRRHFLKLARWFDQSTPADAHVLAAAAFGAYPSRHLGIPLDADVAESVPATASWWHCPPAEVPVSLRERGERQARGRSAAAADHSAQKRMMLARRQEEAERRDAACAELIAVGRHLEKAHLSATAMGVFLELLSTASASGRSRLFDRPVSMWLLPIPGETVVRSDLGRLTIEGRSVTVCSSDEDDEDVVGIGGIRGEEAI